jgi:DNA-binding CsgD family transcriptional regulator/GAF domain-containing protein
MSATSERSQRVFPEPPPTVSWRRREAMLGSRVAELLDRAGEVLSVRTRMQTDEDARPDRAVETVSVATWAAIEQLREGSPPGGPSPAQLHGLVVELQSLLHDLHEHERGREAHRLAACEAALARLREIDSTSELIDRMGPELLRSCGFERMCLGRVEEGMWKPWRFHFTHTEGFEQWIAKWSTHALPLEDLVVESQCLEERRPAIVRDVARNPDMTEMFITAKSPSYVVAPITPGGKVIGLLHADYYPRERPIDELDRDVLWLFAQGFGQIYERTLLLERLRTQREQVRKAMGVAAGIMDDFCNAEVELARQPDHGSVVVHTVGAALPSLDPHVDELTPREREVLALIAVGATNSAIAEKLVITEGTVKSHVKHILRKLGATNRSQAIASYLARAHD